MCEVGWIEQEEIERIVDYSLAGLDAKLGHPRTCPVKEGGMV